MSELSLIKKLIIKTGYKVILINPPDGYLDQIGQLPESSKYIELNMEPADVIQVFVKTMDEALQNIVFWKKSLKPKGILWITYPKGTSKVETDLNRDILWKRLKDYGLDANAIFSVDATWSAMRFKIILE
jgi:hypothetical protein